MQFLRGESRLLGGQHASRDEVTSCKAQARALPKASAILTDADSEDYGALGQAALISPRSTDDTGEREHDPLRDTEHDHEHSFPMSPQDRKRKRLADQHNKSEQRRRRKINAKLDELQAMVPFSRSREKAAILLDVIEYIKSVQAQLHIMSAITACDYAACHGAAPSGDLFLPPIGFGGGVESPCGLPAAIVPPAFPMSGNGGVSSGGFLGRYSGTVPSFGLQGGSSRSGRPEKQAGDGEGGSGSGWSFSSGESSAHFGAVVDNTANSYEPLLFA